jgi:hypothetical protein
MAAPRNDRPAGRAPSDGPVGSDTGVYHLFAWPRFAHLDRPLKRFMEASETLNPQQPCISVSLVSGSISCAVLLAAGSGAFDDLHPSGRGSPAAARGGAGYITGQNIRIVGGLTRSF